MTLHMMFEYPLSVYQVSFPYTGRFFAVHVLTPKNKKKMMTKPLTPSLYRPIKQYRA